MSLRYSMYVILSREGFWRRFKRLLNPKDLDKKLFHLEEQLGSYGERTARMAWTSKLLYDIDALTQEPIDVKKICLTIEHGNYGGRTPGFELRLGEGERAYRDNEQLYLDLIVSPDNLLKSAWCAPDQLILEISLPSSGRAPQQDQNCIRPLLGLTFELLQPVFAFSAHELAYEPFLDRPYQPPWQFYWPTMLYGPQLIQTIGFEKLKTSPSFRLVELEGPLMWLSAPSGAGDEAFFTHAYEFELDQKHHSFIYSDKALKKLFEQEELRHRREISQYLELNYP